jgi:hypothetical protein
LPEKRDSQTLLREIASEHRRQLSVIAEQDIYSGPKKASAGSLSERQLPCFINQQSISGKPTGSDPLIVQRG